MHYAKCFFGSGNLARSTKCCTREADTSSQEIKTDVQIEDPRIRLCKTLCALWLWPRKPSDPTCSNAIVWPITDHLH
jgi:hypothetical protein